MADTFNYFVAGYVLIFGLLGAYIGWLVVLSHRITKKVSQETGNRNQGTGIT